MSWSGPSDDATTRAETGTTDVSASHAQRLPPEIGHRLGRYVVLGPLGAGGMGQVLKAYDPELEREVALKLLKARTLDDLGQSRLVREARAMAKLSHPNVVSVHDVQDTPGGVMIVMELVRGPSLRQWLRNSARPWPEIVRRFVEAGRGLAAAHAEGLLHRDFKPANVLVPEAAEAKVTDFGLAKRASSAEFEASTRIEPAPVGSLDINLTRSGEIMGTPRYMAPEQHTGGALGPPADQFAFCVSLWEALTGEDPFEAQTYAHAVAHKLRGPPTWPGEPPLPPSIPAALRRGLAPEPEDRWPDIDALLDALASDPGRRHRRVALAVAAMGLLGLGGAMTSSWQRPREEPCSGAEAKLAEVWTPARRSAIQASVLDTGVPFAPELWARLQVQLDTYAADWVQMHTDNCEATTIRGEQSADLMDLRMACLLQARLEFDSAAEVLTSTNAQTVGNAHRVVDGLRPLSRCADVEALHADVEAPAPAQVATVERIRDSLAKSRSFRLAGRYDDAQLSLAHAEGLLDTVDYDPIVTEFEIERGDLLKKRSEFESSEAASRAALTSAIRHGQWALARAAAIDLMSTLGQQLARPTEALRYQELATGLAHNDTEVAEFKQALGGIHRSRGKFAEAEASYREALALQIATVGDDHPQTLNIRENIAITLTNQGRLAEAAAAYTTIVSVREAQLGPSHPKSTNTRNSLASVLAMLGQFDEAEVQFRRVLELELSRLGPEHRQVASARSNLASVLQQQGNLEESLRENQLALAVFRSIHGPKHPSVANVLTTMGLSLRDLGQLDRAEQMMREALALWEDIHGPDHPVMLASRNNLGRLLLKLERPREAIALLQPSWIGLENRADVPPLKRGHIAFTLARAQWAEHRDRSRVQPLVRRARELSGEAENGDQSLAALEQWLERRPELTESPP